MHSIKIIFLNWNNLSITNKRTPFSEKNTKYFFIFDFLSSWICWDLDELSFSLHYEIKILIFIGLIKLLTFQIKSKPV